MKKIYRVLMFTILTIGLTNCVQEPSIYDDGTEIQPQDYLDQSDAKVTHKVGTTPCPQVIAEIDISPEGYDDVEEFIPDVDSASVESSHSSIDAFFGMPGKSTTTFGDTIPDTPLIIQFNCAKAESASAVVTCKFYSNGVLVATETVNVVVEVSQ